MASQVVTWALSLVLVTFVPRYLGPEAYGQLTIGQSLWAIAGVCMIFGTPTVLIKKFSREPLIAQAWLRSAATLQLLAYVVCWVGVGAFVLVAGYDVEIILIVAIVGVSVGFRPFSMNGRSALYGLERMDRVAIVEVAVKVVHVAAVLACLAVGVRVPEIAWVSVLSAAWSAFLVTWFVRRLGVRSAPARSGVALVARASRQYLAVDVTLVAYQQIDVVVMSLLVADRTLGWYSTADVLASSLLFVPTIMMASLFPRMARLHHEHPGAVTTLLRRSARVIILAAVPIGLGTVAIATPVSVLLYGPAFAETGPVLAVRGVVLLMTYGTILIGRYAIAIDQQRFWLRLMVAAVAATVAFDLMLVPWADTTFGNGAIGGAAAYLVIESSMLIVGIRRFAPHLVDRKMLRHISKCLLAGAVMFATVWPLRWHFFALPVAIGALTYVLMILALRVPNDDEWAVARTLAARVTSRSRRKRSLKVDE